MTTSGNGRPTKLGEGQSSVSNLPVKRRLQSTLARSAICARLAAHLLQAGLVLMIAHTKILWGHTPLRTAPASRAIASTNRIPLTMQKSTAAACESVDTWTRECS